MGMPRNLVMIRHGQSEPNIIQRQIKDDPSAVAPEGFFDRHDSQMRLSRLGIEQAEITGDFLREEFPEGFDRYYVSPHTRTVETAGRLALGAKWHVDDRWRERDWGEYGVANGQERKDAYELSTKLKEQNNWLWCPLGGESLGTGVRLRFEDSLDTMHRELDGKRVLVVAHGETMSVAQFVLERMVPEEWLERDKDPAYRISNCQVLEYSRVHPKTGVMGSHMEWRRSLCVWDPGRSWDNGEWVHVDRKLYSDEDLLQMAERHPQLLPAS